MSRSSPPTPSQPEVKPGQIWRDNDDRGVQGDDSGVRLVRVHSAGPSYAQIQRCDANGCVTPGSRMTSTMRSRFEKKGRIGFTLVKDAPELAPHIHADPHGTSDYWRKP